MTVFEDYVVGKVKARVPIIVVYRQRKSEFAAWRKAKWRQGQRFRAGRRARGLGCGFPDGPCPVAL